MKQGSLHGRVSVRNDKRGLRMPTSDCAGEGLVGGWGEPLDLCRVNGGDRPLLTSPQRFVR